MVKDRGSEKMNTNPPVKDHMRTRDEFEESRIQWARNMAADSVLGEKSLEVLTDADRYNWIHQTTWFGEPLLQLPQDMFALQEIIFRTRPRFIIEVGVAWGGSLLFYSTLMEVLGGERIIGIDIYIPDDLQERIAAFGKLAERITWINGSSIDLATLDRVKQILAGSRDVLIVLDSNHTHDHVLQELRLYSPLVGRGKYLVCGDTVVEFMPEQTHRPRPWGPGNNPKTALDAFLAENKRFRVDERLENKLLFTCNPGGYLVCCEE
ncbi:MAG TPA: CmcI family methyltransferase [Pyrinomonadaceae bacterium]|nr:CmcI family methyltransferase [Pyrinomonadaceae bacterium]